MSKENYLPNEHPELAWSINESLLQYYRTTFIASQAILVSAAQLTSKDNQWLVILIAIVQLVIGCQAIDARAKIVDYYKFGISKMAFCEKDYVKNKNNCRFEQKIKTWRETRIKIDIFIPFTFMIIWIHLLLNIMSLNTPSAYGWIGLLSGTFFWISWRVEFWTHINSEYNHSKQN